MFKVRRILDEVALTALDLGANRGGHA